MALTATVERPVEATLIVRTETGEEWEATDEDLAKFKIVTEEVVRERYCRFREALGFIVDDEAGERANALRYMVEQYIYYGWCFNTIGPNPRATNAEDDEDERRIVEVIRQMIEGD